MKNKTAPKSAANAKKKKVASAYERPSWDEYFMSIADMVGSRGTCDRGRSGCVIAKDKRILVTGYVGSPIGQPHCDEVGHEMHTVTHEDGSRSMHCIRTIHAEQNAIAQAARLGTVLEGSTVYCKMVPCYVCAKMLINAGVSRVVAAKDYHASKRSKQIFKVSKIKLHIVDPTIETYQNSVLK
jgi:dCMP deaminase